jgi:hypothetical protein
MMKINSKGREKNWEETTDVGKTDDIHTEQKLRSRINILSRVYRCVTNNNGLIGFISSSFYNHS